MSFTGIAVAKRTCSDLVVYMYYYIRKMAIVYIIHIT